MKECRIAGGISLQDLAPIVGRTYQQLQKYETGYNRISAGVLYDLARALKTEPAYFYQGSDYHCRQGKGL